jgi:uncharacterized membrane protein YeaQ/YmgE (transglycosylase-associated protein family)
MLPPNHLWVGVEKYELQSPGQDFHFGCADSESIHLSNVGNSLFRGQEQRTMRETKVPIGNSGLIAKPWPILGDVLKAVDGGKSMFHLLWYVLIGLISGFIARSVMHVQMAIFWTIVLGIIGSIFGGGVSHMLWRPTNERFHPAGLIFSTLGAILVLFICHKLNIHFPVVNPQFR